MPRIPLPKKQVSYPTEAPAVPMSQYPMAAEWQGREIERFGNILSGLGKKLEGKLLEQQAFGYKLSLDEQKDIQTLALRVQKLAIKDEIDRAIIEDSNLIDDEITKLKTENKDPITWGDRINDFFGTTKEARYPKLTTNTAKKEYELWYLNQSNKIKNQMTILGSAQAVENYKGGLSSSMVSLVDSGQIGLFFEHLSYGKELGALTEDNYNTWQSKAINYSIRKDALKILDSAGEEAAISFVKEQTELLDAEQRGDLVQTIKTTAARLKVEAEDATLTNQVASIEGYYTQLSDYAASGKTPSLTIEEINNDPNLDEIMKEDWRNIALGLGKKEPLRKDVDWKKYVELENRLLDKWKGTTTDETDIITFKTDIAKARFADRYISDGMFNEINTFYNMNIPDRCVGALGTSFSEIQKILESPGIRWKYNQQDAQNIAFARSALLTWLTEDRIGRKKETTEDQIVAKARNLAVVYKKPQKAGVIFYYGEPTQVEDFYRHVGELKATDPDSAKVYYDYWKDKWE